MAYTTVNKSSSFMNPKLYTGNDGTHAITGVGFQPDLVWIKPRNYADHHRLIDSVRGLYQIYSNRMVAQDATGSNFASFDSDGFTLGGSDGGWNSSSYNYASWNWKANGSGSANTVGDTDSTVSVNTTAGFSIVKWTGTLANTTVGHGLGVVPKMIIVKCTATNARSWVVYHASLGNTKHLTLQETDAAATSSASWNDTTPTSTVFSLGSSNNANDSVAMIAYCFAEVSGYSKFGSYLGNGNANGTFVYTGFKPAFVLIKRDGAGENWTIRDNKRPGYNVTNLTLQPNTSNAEVSSSDYDIDLLSNGFKLRANSGHSNSSGQTNIYMAFGQPIISNSGIPATAR